MKNKNLFKGLLLSSSFAVLGIVGLTGCDKDDDDDMNNNAKEYTLSGNASGAQEVPVITTNASGTMSGTYNESTNTLSYNINWTNLSGVPTAAHFHGPAATGVSAGVLVPITISTAAISGSASGSVVIVDSVETALLAGRVYYNVHTALNPNGEIRGQVVASPK